MATGSELQRFIEQQIELYGDELALERALLDSARAAAPAPLPAAASRLAGSVREIAEGGQGWPSTGAAVEASSLAGSVGERAGGEGDSPGGGSTAASLAATLHESRAETATAAAPAAPIDLQVATLSELQERISGCLNCAIGRQRQHLVFGKGHPDADIVLVGEAPGYNEDQQGEPFVGEAGQLLTKILAAIQLERSEVYICNLLKCRPTNNRDPLPDEVQNCLPYLEKQLELIRPAFILCLGRFAAQTLLQSTAPLSQLRGRVHERNGAQVIVTYHPAALLRYPKFKTETWQDVQMLRRLYDEFLAKTLPR
ncbi:MAG TPA: uracil-DNA glycosylase [bacterium]|nr:uracil-DNA glycosylase [bacterium]HPR88575.1 uracil-DNA glycosylase [bacterium]